MPNEEVRGGVVVVVVVVVSWLSQLQLVVVLLIFCIKTAIYFWQTRL